SRISLTPRVRFAAAAQPGYGKSQMPVYPTIDQRVEFSFKSLH
ncbi:hypothetical protein LTSEMIN_2566, partial [Salmonella enterica subsp. enterica serovar Minnesota str. A4-603]